jgi:hypothetical protein
MPSIVAPAAKVATPAPAPAAAAAAPARIEFGPEPKPAPVKPLFERSVAELESGLKVDVLGGAPPEKEGEPEPPKLEKTWANLAAARLVQDAADYVATTSGVQPSLAKVYVGDAKPEHRTWAGYAWFEGDKGSFALTKTTSDDLIRGVQMLKDKPFDQWSAHEQSKFASTQETVLHELGHITLPSYDEKTMKSWDYRWRDNHTLEEGLTEIAAQHDLPGFFQHEFGTALPERVADQSRTTSVYRRWTTGLERMFHASGVAEEDYGRFAKQLGDATYPGSRSGTIAKAIAAQHGGDPEGSNGRLTRVIRGSVPGFVGELSGSGGKISASTDAMEDINSGKAFDRKAYEAEIAEDQKVVQAARKQRHDDF